MLELLDLTMFSSQPGSAEPGMREDRHPHRVTVLNSVGCGRPAPWSQSRRRCFLLEAHTCAIVRRSDLGTLADADVLSTSVECQKCCYHHLGREANELVELCSPRGFDQEVGPQGSGAGRDLS